MGTYPADHDVSQEPVFIIGFPRSGTTLLQALLSTQGNVATFPETHFFSTIYSLLPRDQFEVETELIQTVLKDITKASGIEFDSSVYQRAVSLAENGRLRIKDFYELLVKSVLPDQYTATQRWIEKTPSNCHFMTIIDKLYPKVKFLLIIRDPFNAIYSNAKYLPPKGNNPIKQLSKRWVQHVSIFEDYLQTNEEKVMLVKYEDLVSNVSTSIMSVCSFLNIEFREDNLSAYRAKASDIIKPFEHWKNNVMRAEIKNTNQKPRELFSFWDLLRVKCYLGSKPKSYGYGINWADLVC